MKRTLPAFPITAVLVALGADPATIPFGTGWKKMPCFLHPDRTPSAAVNHERNAYICHSCGVKGDPVGMVEQVERIGFKDALAFCEELTGETSERVPRSGWGGTELSL